MTFKKIVSTCLAFCLTATLGVAVSGCDDLGAFEDTTEYYSSFGDIVLMSGASREETDSEDYSVEKYFYNKESKENFLMGEDGAYKGITPDEYVYMAIPLESGIRMDSLALYLQSQQNTAVYISVFVTDDIPSNWKTIADVATDGEETEAPSEDPSGDPSRDGTEAEKIVYDDPDPSTRIGDITVHLEEKKWGSFVLDSFDVNGTAQSSIDIQEGQYVLLQFRNNSGVRVFDEAKQAYVDPQTGLELQPAEITMTNLLVRALNITHETETQGGES